MRLILMANSQDSTFPRFKNKIDHFFCKKIKREQNQPLNWLLKQHQEFGDLPKLCFNSPPPPEQ